MTPSRRSSGPARPIWRASLLVEYTLLQGKDGPEVATVRMLDGVISWEARNEYARKQIAPFMDSAAPLRRNARYKDGSEYEAMPGTRTWLEETVEQRLYYEAGFTYLWSFDMPREGFLVLSVVAESEAYRGINREFFDEHEIRMRTPHPTRNAAALRQMLLIWERGLSENGILQTEADAQGVRAALDDPALWEIVYGCDPGAGSQPVGWQRLGVDIAGWTYGPGSFSVFENFGDVAVNGHGLLSTEAEAQAILAMDAEEFASYEVKEVWVEPQAGRRRRVKGGRLASGPDAE